MSAYLILFVVNLVLLVAGTSGSAISVAFPNIMASFDTSLVLAGWVLSSYQLVATVSMVIMGKLSDTIGKKNTFMVCLGFFTLGSLFGALSPNIYLLILSRVLQSIGGGGFITSTIAIIADLFPNNRQKAIGFSMTVFPLGQIIGPNLGAWLLTTFSWRAIFWLNVPLGLLAFIPVMIALKREDTQSRRVDFTGAGLLAGFMFSLMTGISLIGETQNSSLLMLMVVLLAAFAVLVVFFSRHIIKTKEPIIETFVLKSKPFFSANVYNFLFGACMFGVASFLPLYAVTVYGMSTSMSGLVLAARSIGMISASAVASAFITRWSYRFPMTLGAGIIAVSFVLLGLQPSHIGFGSFRVSDEVFVSALACLSGIGMGMASPAANNACIDLMPEKVGTITGVRGMFRQGGGAISIAVVTLLVESVQSYSYGFRLTFIGMAALMLLSLPFIYGMPERAT